MRQAGPRAGVHGGGRLRPEPRGGMNVHYSDVFLREDAMGAAELRRCWCALLL